MAKDRVIYPQDHKPPTKKQIELHNMRKVFKQIGGWRRMAEWADKEPGEFYTKIWARALPKEVIADVGLSEGGPNSQFSGRLNVRFVSAHAPIPEVISMALNAGQDDNFDETLRPEDLI